MKKQVINAEEFTTAEKTRWRHHQPFSSSPEAHEVIRPIMSLTEARVLSRAARKLIIVKGKIERGLETMSEHLRTALTARMNANPRYRQSKKETSRRKRRWLR